MDMPSIKQWLEDITAARDAARETQHKVQESWVKERPRYKAFSTGDKVWLEGTNLRLPATVDRKSVV